MTTVRIFLTSGRDLETVDMPLEDAKRVAEVAACHNSVWTWMRIQTVNGFVYVKREAIESVEMVDGGRTANVILDDCWWMYEVR